MTELRRLNVAGKVDTNNSTSTPLGISGIFTGLDIGLIYFLEQKRLILMYQ